MSKSKSKLLNILLIILCLTILIIPLLVRYNTYLSISSKMYFNYSEDLFNWLKSKVTIFFGIIMLILDIVVILKSKKDFKNELKKEPIIYLLFLYAVLIILSTLFSEYKDVALFGASGRYEGMFVLLSYLISVFTVLIVIDDKDKIKKLIKFLYILIALLTILGLSQRLGKNLLQMKLFKIFIFPLDIVDSINIQDSHMMYLTFGNMNFVGSFAVFCFTLCFSLFLLTKDIKYKILHGLFTLFSFFLLTASTSRAGYISCIISVTAIIIFLNKKLFSDWKLNIILLIFVSIFISVFIVMDNRTNKSISNKFISGIKSQFIKSGPPILKYIDMNDNKIRIEFDNSALNIERVQGKISFYDKDNNLINFFENPENNEELITDSEEFKIFKFKTNGDSVRMESGLITLNFQFINDKFKVVTSTGLKTDIGHPEVSTFFVGREKNFSSRGYIWGTSIPLIKNSLLIGKGPDTFIFEFPQNDYVGKRIGLGDPYMVVDKPHNMYLQIAINTGFVSLLIFLTIIAIFEFRNIKYFFKYGISEKSALYFAIFIAVNAYLITGIINDSKLGIANIFWIFLGIGFTINKVINISDA